MTVSTPSTTTNFLRTSLRGNAVFSGASGLLLIAAASPLSDLMGIRPPAALAGLGLALLIFAAGLLWAAFPAEIDRRLGLTAVALDLLWIAGSALLLLSGWLPLTTFGVWTIVIVADIVALFAIWQGYGLWRQRQA